MTQSPHNTMRVRITSIDGNIDHPFRPDQTIADVRRFAYDRLVSDKALTSYESTWIEHAEHRVDDATVLSSIADPNRGHGNEIDIKVTLAWTSQGG